MRTRRLGSSDLEVTVVGLGCNNFGGRLDAEGTARRGRRRARRRHQLLRHRRHLRRRAGHRGTARQRSGAPRPSRDRDQVRLAKMGDGRRAARGSRAHPRAVEAACGGSAPTASTSTSTTGRTAATPIEETLAALDGSSARARSARSAAPTSRLAARRGRRGSRATTAWRAFVARAEPVLVCSTAGSSRGPARLRALGARLLPYFPLASGLLTGKYRRGEPAPRAPAWHGARAVAATATFDVLEALEAFARERGARCSSSRSRGCSRIRLSPR